MAETDKDQKTEQPTGKRLADAFKEGQFAQSPDVGIAVGLAVTFCLLLFVVPDTARRLAERVRSGEEEPFSARILEIPAIAF